MARARNIKPGFFKNYELADMGPYAQILFAGLWCLADREGRLEDKPRLIKAEIFPYYDCDVNGELTKLERLKLVDRYEADGIAVIQVCNFKKHQTPHNTEKASSLPARSAYSPEKPHAAYSQEINGGLTVDSPKSNGGNPPDSLIHRFTDSLIPDSPNGVMPQAAPAAPKKSRKPAKTSLPDDFCISEAVRDWADRNGVQHLDRHFDSFVTKVRANGYTYVNWDAALQNAISDDWAKLNTHQARGSPPGYQTANDKAKSLADRLTGNRNEQRHTIIDITPSPADQLD